MMRNLKAFHGDQAIKDKYLTRLAAHRVADELIQGTGWENGKGCAVGCTLENYEHVQYEVELGIPEMLARLEDVIFEGLKNGKAQAWPERFLSAIKPGSDLSRVGWKFLHWLLTESKIGAYDHPQVRGSVRQCADVLVPLKEGRSVDVSAAESARAAESAAESARAAGWAARSAESAAEAARSAAGWAARSAARSAGWAAGWAAESARAVGWAESAAGWAESAAEAAGWTAESARWAARWAAESAWEKMAEKLESLLKEAA